MQNTDRNDLNMTLTFNTVFKTQLESGRLFKRYLTIINKSKSLKKSWR